MGSGKTTIGRQLAARLGLEFLDSDLEIEQRTGVDIPTIFDYEGEAGFRKRERKVIDELTQQAGIVLATGGGAVLDPDNRRDLSARGLVIYLQCAVDQQFHRTARDRNRPLLHTEDPRTRLQRLMEERDPLYLAIADLVVPTGQRSVGAVVQDILAMLDAAPNEP